MLKHLCSITLSLGCAVSLHAAAREYVVDNALCDYMAGAAVKIARDHEAGVPEFMLMQDIRDPELASDRRHAAAMPLLVALIRDYSSGVLAIPSGEIRSEVIKMCRRQIGTPINLPTEGTEMAAAQHESKGLVSRASMK